MTASTQRSIPAERAERLLAHYLRRVWVEAGLQWNSDNDAEVGSIVDALVEAAADVVSTHEMNAPHLCADGSIA